MGFIYWHNPQLPVASVDPETGDVQLTGHTWANEWYAALDKDQRYVIENLEAGLVPGRWWHDRKGRRLVYVPRRGESPDRVAAEIGGLDRIIQVEGTPREPAERITIRGGTWEGAGAPWGREWRAFPQAESDIPAAIRVDHARSLALEGVSLRRVEGYGIELLENVQGARILRSNLSDLGAGGIRIGRGEPSSDAGLQTGGNLVEDCRIWSGGRLYPAAIGIQIMVSPDNVLRRNWIEDFYYTAISVGWSWGYNPTRTENTLIEDNDLHRLGQGLLSDMGGIYTLGVSPGSVLRGNRMSGVTSYDYGGWGIYFDEGSTGWRAENNVVWDTKSAGFHQHYGRENVVENNVFARARLGLLRISRPEAHLSATVTRNIFLGSSPEIIEDGTGGGFGSDRDAKVVYDSNLYWSEAGRVSLAGKTLTERQQTGRDGRSRVGDPMLANPAQGDFRLRPGSSAGLIGFRPFTALAPRKRPREVRLLPRLWPEGPEKTTAGGG